ncbi:unnamed protein product [Amoebophrya sp. A120]|nr:unnamed protein product [Amoebophrya sp. A120]|eukprot:GSA120T00025763001.1
MTLDNGSPFYMEGEPDMEERMEAGHIHPEPKEMISLLGKDNCWQWLIGNGEYVVEKCDLGECKHIHPYMVLKDEICVSRPKPNLKITQHFVKIVMSHYVPLWIEALAEKWRPDGHQLCGFGKHSHCQLWQFVSPTSPRGEHEAQTSYRGFPSVPMRDDHRDYLVRRDYVAWCQNEAKDPCPAMRRLITYANLDPKGNGGGLVCYIPKWKSEAVKKYLKKRLGDCAGHMFDHEWAQDLHARRNRYREWGWL